jgi:hypothetical protein
MLGELGNGLEVAERWDGAYSAWLDGERVGRAVGEGRSVAGSAGELTRSG